MAPANEGRDLNADAVLAFEAAAAVGTCATFQTPAHARSGAVATESRVVD
jgi:hypothetical protein